MVLDIATRTCDGVAMASPTGKTLLMCGRCHQYFPQRSAAIGRYRKDAPFLDTVDSQQGWEKRSGIYTAERNGRSWHRPAPGSRVKCPTCQWVNTVPPAP